MRSVASGLMLIVAGCTVVFLIAGVRRLGGLYYTILDYTINMYKDCKGILSLSIPTPVSGLIV